MTLTCIVLLLGILVWLYLKPTPYRLPPGPAPWPLVGNLPFLMDLNKEKGWFEQDGAFMDLFKKHGKIVTMYSPDPVVMIIGYEEAKAAYAMEEMTARDENVFSAGLKDYMLLGIAGTSGRQWREQRRFALHTLRDFGLGKNKLDIKINEELDMLIKEIEHQQGTDFDCSESINIAVSNIICAMVFGHRFDYDDTLFQRMVNLQTTVANDLMWAFLSTMIPFAAYLPGDMFKLKQIKQNISEIRQRIILPEIKRHKDTFQEDNIEDFIDAFILEMNKHKEDTEQHWFNEVQLQYNIWDLFFAGTDTTTTSLRWAIASMILYPEVQKKVRAEILDTIGPDRAPSMKDKTNMPYVEATICEIQRMFTITNGPTHRTYDEPVEFMGYVLPPKTSVIVMIQLMHMDPEYWDEPKVFKPERFLTNDGKFKKDEHLITFSTGKRSCLGESLAVMELFLFFTKILQKCHILPAENGEKPLLIRVPGIIQGPKHFNARFVFD